MLKKFLATVTVIGIATATLIGVAAPAAATQDSEDESAKISICHRDNGHPEYVEIEIAVEGLNGHLNHPWAPDIYPVPELGCAQPEDVTGSDVTTETICDTEQFVTTTTNWSRTYVLFEGQWVLGDVVYGDPEVVTRDATAEELSEAECEEQEPDIDYVLAAWYVPGGLGSIFDPDQSLITYINLEDPSLSALDDYGFEWPHCVIQIDLYYDNADTAALMLGGVLYSPNNPTEPLAFGALGAGANPWKYIILEDCTEQQPDPESGEDVTTEVVCASGKFVTTTTSWTQAYVAEGDGWVLGEKVYGEPKVDSRDATTEEQNAAKCVTALEPPFTDSECTEIRDDVELFLAANVVTSGHFTIPSKTGVQYTVSVDGSPFTDYSAGDYDMPDGTEVVVKATALPGYTLQGQTEWSHTFGMLGECDLGTLGPVQPAVSFAQLACNADGSYTLGSPTPGDAAKLRWTVNGIPDFESGTYAVTTPTTITVVAVAVDPINDPVEFDWENPPPFAFALPGGCELTTLALTGGSTSSLGLSIAGGLLLLGVAAYSARRRFGVTFE